MTSQSTIRKPQHAEGPTVRDVVEYQHELVNEVWCRKILRQVLQSLEAQYAAHMPHRAITPDTIVFQDNGEPMLLASPYVAAEPGLAADLRALAAVIHYAITLELAPAAPLRGRRLDGYSDSLLGAVDKCLSPDLRQRPQTIDELRNLLGIVSVGASPPATPRKAAPARAQSAAAAHAEPAAAPSARSAATPPGRARRWLLIGLAALVLLGAAMGLTALLRSLASRDAVVLSLPPAARTAPGLEPSEAPSKPAPAVAAQEAAQPVAPAATSQPGVPAPAPGPAPEPYDPDLATARAAMEARAAAAGTAQPAPPVRAPEVRAAPATRAEPAATALITYRLQVRPWATVYVDGEERGVSPPLKRLALPPGQHTVRLVNPSFPDRIIRIEAGSSRPGTIAHDFSARRGPRR